jgi:hypothetical protein
MYYNILDIIYEYHEEEKFNYKDNDDVKFTFEKINFNKYNLAHPFLLGDYDEYLKDYNMFYYNEIEGE